jgi:flagellar biosynthesis/type III secretory pathway chaperone
MRKIEEELVQLEETLVSEFRLLQSLLEVTQKESSALLKGSQSILMPIVEDKEAILDQLGVLEETRQKVTQSLSSSFGISTQQPVTIKALLPHIDEERAQRIRRLCDGILALSEQQRGLNLNVSTMAQSWIEMIHSTQAYLLSFYQTPVTYQPPGLKAAYNLAPVWATEHRA